MSSEEDRLKRAKARNRNIYAKVLYDPNEKHGAYRMKVIDGRKEEYKRVKLRVTDDYEEED